MNSLRPLVLQNPVRWNGVLCFMGIGGILFYGVRNAAGNGFEFFFAENFSRDGKEDVVLFVDVINENPHHVLSC